MRWGIALSICVIVLLSAPVFAQESSRPVIDPATIFAPGVEVVETLPVLNYDNDARFVWYFDPQQSEWQSYPYPPDLAQVGDYQRRSDGTYLLSNRYYQGITEAIWDEIWLFDPATEEIKRPAKTCNLLVQALPGEGQWQLAKLDDGLYRLCNTETGKFSDPLPLTEETYDDAECSSSASGFPALSPNKDWVVFYSCTTDFSPPMHVFYAYQVSTNIFVRLGTTDIVQYIEMADWIDGNHPLINAGMVFTGGSQDIYVGDVEATDNLKSVASQYAYVPLYLPDPPRSYWVALDSGADFQATDEVEQSIYRYDFTTGTEKTIFSHTCEFQYCETGYVIWGDDNLVVTRNGYPLGYDFHADIWDVQSGQAIYSIIADTIYFLDKDTFLFAGYDPQAESYLLREVSVKNGFPDETILSHGYENHATEVTLSPAKNYALIMAGASDIYGIDVYDLKHKTQSTLVSPLTEDNYAIRFEWKSEEILQIDLNLGISCDDANIPCVLGSWLVRLPDESAAS